MITLVTSYFYQQEVQQPIHRDLATHILAEELLIEDGEIVEGTTFRFELPAA